jgi:hypothetical protein
MKPAAENGIISSVTKWFMETFLLLAYVIIRISLFFLLLLTVPRALIFIYSGFGILPFIIFIGLLAFVMKTEEYIEMILFGCFILGVPILLLLMGDLSNFPSGEGYANSWATGIDPGDL